MKARTCEAPRDRTDNGIGGPRCGAPATKRDNLRRPVCDSCFEWSEERRRDPFSFGSVLHHVFHSDPSKKN